MRVLITTAGVTITDLDALNSLDAVADEGVDIDHALRVEDAGYLVDAEHIAVSISALRAAAQSIPDPTRWEADFRRVVAYAESKGWVLDNGSTLRAHLVS